MNQGLLILLFLSGAVTQCSAVAGYYYKVMINKTWAESQAYCRALVADLCTIKSDFAVETIQNFTLKLNMPSKAWIGLYYDNTWKWSDGTATQYFKWYFGQPDGNTSEYCGAFYDGYFYDELCMDKLHFFCFISLRTRKILQLRVQSDQDPNDPGVQEAVTQQIQQKLMVHGLVKNVTVRWKQQPGGKVFIKQN